MNKYKQNLSVNGNNVYSYGTHVATISGSKLIRHGHWSMTTSKHINYVAKEYGLTLVDGKPDDEPEVKNDSLKTAGLVALMGNIIAGDSLEEKNAWKKRMLNTVPGISFPDDFDNLTEKEKQDRLDKAIEFSQNQK